MIGPGLGEGIGGRLEHGSAGVIVFHVSGGLFSFGKVNLFIHFVNEAFVTDPMG